MLEGNVMMPFLYTRVICCPPTLGNHYDVTSLELVERIHTEANMVDWAVSWNGTVNGVTLDACDIPRFAPNSKLWSMSPTCVNKAYVQDDAQALMGLAAPIQKFVGLSVLPVGSAIADAAGRRPVLMAYGSACLTACLLLMCDTQLHDMWGDFAVFIAITCFCVCWETKDGVLNSAIADIVGDDEGNKGRAFSVLLCMNTIGSVVALMVAFFCLRQHLESYFVPWFAFSGVALSVILLLKFVVPETLPAELQTQVTAAMLNPVASQLGAARILAKDKVLIIMAVIAFLWGLHFIGWICMHFSYFIASGFSMEEAILPGTIGNLCQVLFALTMTRLLPRIGAWNCYVLGHSFFAAAYFSFGLYTVFVSTTGIYAGCLLTSAAFASYLPAYQTIVSQRVGKESQSRVMGTLAAVQSMGAIIGVPLYSKHLFDGTASGWDRALPVNVSLVLALLCTVLAAMAYAIASRDIVSDESSSEEEDDEDPTEASALMKHSANASPSTPAE